MRTDTDNPKTDDNESFHVIRLHRPIERFSDLVTARKSLPSLLVQILTSRELVIDNNKLMTRVKLREELRRQWHFLC